MANQNLKIISFEEALSVAYSNVQIIGNETVHFKESLGKILATDVFSDINIPPFNKSAMDGYACRKEDLKNDLTVLETIPAGIPPTFSVSENCCSKIMTGAKVPEGADTVIMVEHTKKTPDGKIRFTGEKTSTNICLSGEDLQKGSLVLNKGTLIKPQHLAILASVGCVQPRVYKTPKLGILSTGSELTEPGNKITPSKIRNSNGHQLIAQCKELGIDSTYYGIVRDSEKDTVEAIKRSAIENDLTIISGGVSVGDFDFVPHAIRKNRFHILFKRLSVKPGQHTTFAFKDTSLGKRKYIIGLPGNPVSSFIQFELFVKPFIYKLQGINRKEINIPIRMAQNFTRKKTDRKEYLPVILNKDYEAELVKYNGSAHIHAYHNAFGVISIEIGQKEINKGDTVYVRPI